MTSLFCSSSVDELKAAEATRSISQAAAAAAATIPSNQLRQKVQRIVHHARLKRNDVHLALLLIYRRKMMAPLALPQNGGEGPFELLCIALLLGHKSEFHGSSSDDVVRRSR